MRLIDADKLPNYHVFGSADVGPIKNKPIECRIVLWKDIEKASIVDAVPVVRCKNCQYSQTDGLGVLHCHKHHIHTKSDDFCSYGERKEQDNE